MAKITLANISKSYRDARVLKGINLDIADGEFLTLVGPSGCGKSTLLRIIAGLDSQDGGDVLIDGSIANNTKACERDLSMVFQSYALYPHLSVRKNMETPLKLRDLSIGERLPCIRSLIPKRRAKIGKIQQIVAEVSATLKIDHLLERKPGQLSGGQRQRVALGRAMVRKPVAFLMDEPLSNLDATLRIHMRAELAELHQKLGVTFIYVTHDQAEALTMSDRMAVMMDGQILQLGTPDEIYKTPIDRTVAEFVGSPKINLFPADVDNYGVVTAYGVSLQRQVAATSCKAVVGVRPEHLQLVAATTDNEHWSFHIIHKENLGSDFFLHGHINGSKVRTVARVTPHNAAKLTIGSEVFLQAVPNSALVFGEDDRRLQFRDLH